MGIQALGFRVGALAIGTAFFCFAFPFAVRGDSAAKNAAGPVASVTDSAFEATVLRSEQPVIVDFWAEWCPNCKDLAPLVERWARKYGRRLKVVKLDVEVNPRSPKRFGVSQLPAILLFDKGRVVKKWIGVVGAKDVQKSIESHLGLNG